MKFLEKLIRQSIWRVLPVQFRRRLLSWVFSLLAPRIDTHSEPRLPVIVVGTFRSATGLGESARLCYSALKAENIPVKAVDITTHLSQPIDMEFPVEEVDDEQRHGIAVLHVNAPLIPLTLTKLGKRFVEQKHIVGYWAWELPKIPADWHKGMDFVHAIWVPSCFTRDAIKPTAGELPVAVIPHPVAQCYNIGEPKLRRKKHLFEVLTIFNFGSSFARKNPIAAIAAFKLAFGNDEDVRLIIKTINTNHYPEGMKLLTGAIAESQNITIIDAYMKPEEMAELYSRADVILSLHRSEGFGLSIAEGMLHGKPVIATNWSGNIDYMNEATAAPISFDLTSATDDQYTYDYPDMQWACANIDEAAIALSKLRYDVKFREQIGKAASKHARQMLGTKQYSIAVKQALGLET